MKRKIFDIHSHIVPNVDDGAINMAMAVQMLRNASEQGVHSIVCTSHSGCNINVYNNNFKALQDAAKRDNVNINLYAGCEVYCDADNLSRVAYGLSKKNIHTINNTKYVLIEFDPYTTENEMMTCVTDLRSFDYIPVIAHVERYYCVHNHMELIKTLCKMGCLLQINAYSLESETNKQIKNCARQLLSAKYVSFIGSDAHRINHRPYKVKSGIDYIYDNCDISYADDVCYKNAENLFISEVA